MYKINTKENGLFFQNFILFHTEILQRLLFTIFFCKEILVVLHILLIYSLIQIYQVPIIYQVYVRFWKEYKRKVGQAFSIKKQEKTIGGI